MKRPIQVSFRITEKQAEQLDQRRGTASRGECARQLMIDGLAGQCGQDFQRLVKFFSCIRTELEEQYSEQTIVHSKTQRQVDALAEQLNKLREDLAMAIAGVLMNLGQAMTQEEAEDFAYKTILADVKKNHSNSQRV